MPSTMGLVRHLTKFSTLLGHMKTGVQIGKTPNTLLNAYRPLRSKRGVCVFRSVRACSSTAVPEVVSKPGGEVESNVLLGEMSWPGRSHSCGVLRESNDGEDIQICGWVDRYRNHGGVLFIDIRDHTGLLQVVSQPQDFPEVHSIASKLRNEYVVCVSGVIRKRKDPNPRIPTGLVELVAKDISILNTVNKLLPFAVSEAEEGDPPTEIQRLKNRVLDLRRPVMGSNLRLRHKMVKAIRRFLEDEHDFVEIETPVLTKSTPEGARDYIVPSRTQQGEWYALPQSPQLFKQMLMVAGYDRYYQIARCFRDEDLRADRQPEFTQLDMEMSFLDQEGVVALMESMIGKVFEDVKGLKLDSPFPRMTYEEAMNKYGTDRPDARFGLTLFDVTPAVAESEFRVFSGCVSSGGIVKAIKIPNGDRISNSRVKPKGDVTQEAALGGAKGLVYIRVRDGMEIDCAKPVKEGLCVDQKDQLLALTGAVPGDLLLLCADNESVVNKSLDRIRQFLARNLGEVDEGKHALLWVTDFPMFEENEGRLEALHHPFTAPNPDTVGEDGDLTHSTALAYDLIYNGVEIGGGSLRIYRRDVQERVFETIGMSDEESKEKFGFLLDCFDFGAPPHAGIAFGLDRLAMLLSGSTSIRDVIAFPKTTQAQCLLTGAPAGVSEEQVTELGVEQRKLDKGE